jgi:NADH dehydrogenase
MTLTPQRILVLGGSGFVGRALCETLQRQGHRVTVPSRRERQAQGLTPLPAVTVVRGDVLNDPALLARVLPGHDAVVNLIAILQGNHERFEAVHVEWPRRLAQACLSSGVTRLVHVSALGIQPVGDGEGAPSRYLRSKARGEAALRSHAGLRLTVLRPSVIFGAGDRFLNLFARLQAISPVMPLAGADAQLQPVWVGDVAEAIARCLSWRDTEGQTYELAGPEVKTLRELVRLAGAWSGHPRPVLPLPGPLAWLQALALECLPGEPLMSRDNLGSLRVPNVATGSLPGLASLGIAPHSLAAIAPAYLAPGQGVARLDGLRARR